KPICGVLAHGKVNHRKRTRPLERRVRIYKAGWVGTSGNPVLGPVMWRVHTPHVPGITLFHDRGVSYWSHMGEFGRFLDQFLRRVPHIYIHPGGVLAAG